MTDVIPKPHPDFPAPLENKLRLSREERDYIAGHALNSVQDLALALANTLGEPIDQGGACSGYARKIAALSKLLGDIGWQRTEPFPHLPERSYLLGELFPVAQLRPWLEEWQRQDESLVVLAEQSLEIAELAEERDEAEGIARWLIAAHQTQLGTGAILLARIEKWMASHGN